MSTPNTSVIPEKTNYQSYADFWCLPKEHLSDNQRQRLLWVSMQLNAGQYSRGVAHLNADAVIKAVNTLTTGPDAIDSPLRFLSLVRLARTNTFRVNYGYNGRADFKPQPDWFKLDDPCIHIGMNCLQARKGSVVKHLLAAGCHPVLIFASQWCATDLPGPKQVARSLLQMSSSTSIDACKIIFNALDSSCSDPALFRFELAEAARSALSGVWLERKGVANDFEQTAVLQCAFAFERLSKKKSLPADLTLARAAVEAKRASFSEPATFAFSPVQIHRMKALQVIFSRDDHEAFAVLAPLCGLDSIEAFEAGVPARSLTDYPPSKYWGSRLAFDNAFACAAHLFEKGENPWLCEGDGPYAEMSKGNPFTWLFCHSANGGRPGFPAFASAVAHAALRDAETRQPGHGRSSCLEAFDKARVLNSDRLSVSGPGPAIVMSACEQALLPSMLLDTQDKSEIIHKNMNSAGPRKSRL